MQIPSVIIAWAVAVILAAPAAAQQKTPLTIYRDDFGVPHIYADSEELGFYGLGYAQAEDGLEGLLKLYLGARGELAAVEGAKLVPSDLAARQWMHTEEARAGFARMSPQLQNNYRYYVAGIQHYMDQHPAETPKWAPKLEPWDPIALPRFALWLGYQAGAGLADCRRGGVQLSQVLDSAVNDQPKFASDEWVVAPWRTADNATVVLSDPHGPIEEGNVFYEFQMNAGKLDIAGYSVGAMPLLTHNRTVSWGMTTGSPDVADCFEVDVDAQNPQRYLYDGEWKTITTREVTVAVKDSAPVTRTYEYTHHNGILSPVVARKGSKAYVVSSPYMHVAELFDEEVYRMNLARNVAEVREAMKHNGMFPQNVMVGDAEGNTFYVRAGRTPRRPLGFDWDRPVPGNTSKSAWLGIHPFEDLVQVKNPPQGYMVNDNIAPDRMMENSPLTADRYPSYIFGDTAGRTNTRGLRTLDVLSQAFHFTVKDAIDLALDEKWQGTEAWRRILAQALNQNTGLVASKPELFRRFADQLLHFDGFAHADSVAALDYYYWQIALWSGPEASRLTIDAVEGSLWTGTDINPAAGKILLDGIDRAIAAMVRERGSIDGEIGDVFRIGRGGESWPMGGVTIVPDSLDQCRQPIRWDRYCLVTVRAMTFGSPDAHGQRWPVGGSRVLRLVIFTNPIQTFTLHPFGQSENPKSPYYDDQARLSSERRLKPGYFEKAELMKHVVSTEAIEVRITAQP
jgi:acyl-homoserine lactone acylase PvdQ